ncbi:MAG: phage portal protein [Anaerolineales bacterium]|nr:phage portal protein [Anaerolineales bacterium]
MAILQSLGQITELQPGWSPGIYRYGVSLYDTFTHDYATLYRTQPNIRTCVDFLARNIAQLGLHVFRRVSDTDRQRLTDHLLALRLSLPLPADMKVTRYRLMEALMSDMGIYFNAYWLKLRQDGELSGLLRIPPIYVAVLGSLIPKGYELNLGGAPIPLMPNDLVHFRGFNPENAVLGLSPMETLRRVLAEEYEAGEYREHFWQNAARQEGVINRPTTAPEWSDAARERFLADFEELHSGAKNSGKTVVLEEGMEWQDTSFNAQESEYLAGRKLTREECARAYHIPLPMVGILDNATFSNISEQHKNLYQDSLGPWCEMIQEDIELQLLPEFTDTTGVYVEFNIAEKLRGSFEEQTASLQAAVGRPWMTANEARARMNLPSLPGDADSLVTPLNVLIGGQASPQDSAPPPKGVQSKSFSSEHAALREHHQQKWIEVLAHHYRRQEAAIVSRVPKSISGNSKTDIGGVWWDDDRWNDELTADLLRLNNLTATAWADYMIEQTDTDIEDTQIFHDRMLPWLSEHSRRQAVNFNTQARDAVSGALREPDALDAVKGVFTIAITVWAVREAIGAVTTASNFGSTEAANAGNLKNKRWRTNSQNPRESHQAMNGETVGIREKFSNGLRWPGDPSGSAEDNANCQCSVDFL